MPATTARLRCCLPTTSPCRLTSTVIPEHSMLPVSRVPLLIWVPSSMPALRPIVPPSPCRVNPSIYGQNIVFTAQLTSSQGVPTGTVQFTDGSVVLGTAAVSGTGAALITLNALSIGSHPISAVYQPTGSFNATMATLAQTVDGYPSTTTSTCSPAAISIFSTASLSAMLSSSYGTPTGSVQFTDNGALLAPAALNNGLATHAYTAQTVGSHLITASYLPSNAFGSSSGSCSETVTALPSLSVLAVAPTAAVFGSPVAFPATESPAHPPRY